MTGIRAKHYGEAVEKTLEHPVHHALFNEIRRSILDGDLASPDQLHSVPILNEYNRVAELNGTDKPWGHIGAPKEAILAQLKRERVSSKAFLSLMDRRGPVGKLTQEELDKIITHHRNFVEAVDNFFGDAEHGE